jgi:hypothetical protein
MRPSPWSIGFVMIVLGGATLLYANSQGIRPTAVGAIVAGALALAGFWLMLRRQGAFAAALIAGGLTAATGVAGFILHHPVGLPLPPIVSLVAGLYVCLRVLIARPGLAPDRRRAESEAEPPPDASTPPSDATTK